MKIEYNKEALKTMTDSLSAITGLSIAVLNTKKEYVISSTVYEPNKAYCSLVHKANQHTCLCSDLDLLEQCDRQKKAVSHICHAGLLDTAVPIMKDGNTVGYIMLGRMRVEADFDKICEKMDFSFDYATMKSAYEQLHLFDEIQKQSVINIAGLLTSVILTDNIILPWQDSFTEQIDRYIETHLEEPLSVTALCDRFHISKNRLYECYRNYHGESVNEYINRIRFEKAKQYLTQTQLSMEQIGSLCGIPNETYFPRWFHKKAGCTPLQFRKKALQK